MLIKSSITKFKFRKNINSVVKYLHNQTKILNNTAFYIRGNESDLAANPYTNERETYSTNVYGFDTIFNDVGSTSARAESFADKVKEVESSKFGYEIASLAIIVILTVIGIIGKIRI